MKTIHPLDLKEALHDGREIGVFDVREHGQFGEGHLFHAIPLPYSRLELGIAGLAPRRSARIVVVDDDGRETGVAALAAKRLSSLGYTDVHVLDGGVGAWKRCGFVLFAGVNLPSKTFGEWVEQTYHTPRVSAHELAAMLERQEGVVVLDGRPLTEYRKMTIPTSTCCPNGELAYRVRGLVPDERTPIVVNCAGRTRSIIGAQTLINLGIRNPVYALENGTQGWHLQDLPLEHGAERRYREPAAVAEMAQAAGTLARRFGVVQADAAQVLEWADDGDRTLYLLDVRTPEEFAAGTLPGAVHAPGGQLVQATDQYVGVRHARLVLFDADNVRASVVASWLRQMGHDAYVLKGGIASGLALAPAQAPRMPPLPPAIDAAALARRLSDQTAAVIDLRPSMDFRKSHVPGARWAIRPRLQDALRGLAATPVFIADHPGIAACAAVDAREMGYEPLWLEGGLEAWRAQGGPVASSPGIPADEACIDYLFFVHDRHDGNKEAARRYLAWETGLLAQLDARELSAFRPGQTPQEPPARVAQPLHAS